MENFLRDLRHSVRMFRQSPGFTIAAIAALALGIGANTAVFSVVNTVLLRPVPFPDPDRLLIFRNISPQGSGSSASPVKFNVLRQETAVLQDVAAFHSTTRNVTSGDSPEQVAVGEVSADFFPLFGAVPAQGRTFSAEEDRPNGGRVAVLSHGLWQRRFGGDPAAVGQSISLDTLVYTVVGVLAPTFRPDGLVTFAAAPPDIWVPFQIDPASAMHGSFFIVGAKLKPGVTLGAAQARLKLMTEEFRTTYPDALRPGESLSVERIRDVQVSAVRSSLIVLIGAVSFVLLIACANVASLLLVRATVRAREMAIRAAIGAGRGRIVRQLLTESLLLSLAGGVAGLGLGTLGIRALLSLNPGNIPRIGIRGANVTLDWRVAAYTVAISVLTGLIFGLVPALQASRADLQGALKEGSGRSGTGARQNRARAVLVVSEIALALVLLVGASLLIRTFVALRTVNPGFDQTHVLTMRMAVTGSRFLTTASTAQMMQRGIDELRTIPGVEAAATTCCVPLDNRNGLPYVIPGKPHEGPFNGGGSWYTISADYFSVFKIPIVRGRAFTDGDTAGAPPIVIINQALAKQQWPDGDPLRDQLVIGGPLVGPEFNDPPRQIVGIVGDVRDGGLNRDPEPAMYVPYAQLSDGLTALNAGIMSVRWIVRTRGEPQAAGAVVQETLRKASGGLPVAQLRTMEDIVASSTASADFNMFLLTVFGVSALVLAAIGVYGLMAYSVQQRTQEIGIRRALGADERSVRNLILVQGLKLAVVGVVIGLASAFGVSRVLASQLFGVTVRDPVVFIGAPTVLAVVALLAIWLPAQRAARVDPLTALRSE